MRRLMAAASLSLMVALSLAGCQGPVGPAAGSTTAVPAVATATQVDADPRIGAIFLGDGNTHSCTASVVHSATGDLVLTAAHCMIPGLAAAFVPGFSGSVVAEQVWPVTAVYLDPRWIADQDPAADYAIVRVARADSAPIEAAVGGAFVLDTTAPAGSEVVVTGYPFGTGGGPVGCHGVTGRRDGFPALDCVGLVDGTSGAPWISASTVTGVTGGPHGGGCADDVSFASPFDDSTERLLARAQAGGLADVPPDMAIDDC